MRRPARLRSAIFSLNALAALLGAAATAQAHGSAPEPTRILLRADRPEQVILATNFGVIVSEDGGKSWLFSCERGVSAYAGPYLLGAPPASRLFALSPGAGLIYSDDESCNWNVAGGVLSDVLPYAFAVDPSNEKRVYAIGAARVDLRAGDSIYVSDDAGITFGEPAFTAPPGSLLLTISVAPSRPSTLFATLYSASEQHPILLRSLDSGAHWEVAADLVVSLGENPFELVAIHPLDENRLYARVLKASAETLSTSEDGGLSFVESVSIPGKLNAFLRLASGTILVGGTSGTDAVNYRSRDDARSFEPWPEAPHVHALAERGGKLYIAADPFADGYVLAASDDEGTHVMPLSGFQQVRGVMGCAASDCTERCAYYAGIQLWPAAVCEAEASSPSSQDEPFVPAAPEVADAGPDDGRAAPRASGGRCALDVIASRGDHRLATVLLAWVALLSTARRTAARRTATRRTAARRRGAVSAG